MEWIRILFMLAFTKTNAPDYAVHHARSIVVSFIALIVALIALIF